MEKRPMICPACNSKYEESITFCPKDGTALVPDDSQVQSREGQILAERYRIVRMLGEGGMGEVYEAEHIYIKKRVALKLLRNEITSNAEAVTRFHQEALAASTIGHDNIVAIDDFGRLPDGSVYLTMEYLAGEPLSDLMLKGRLEPGRSLEIIMQICRGLAAAHSKGIIHRDMKPENVSIVADKDGRDLAKILDFGIAKVTSADSGENLTRTGTIFGTPHYMSPEQAMGRQLDHRTDIYSVGVIMYELFTGTVPFKAESFMGILTQHITALPQNPRTCAPDREIHPEIERIILTAMAKEPEKRYPSMVELLEDLQNVKQTVTGMGAPAPAAAAGGGWGTTAGTQARPVATPPPAAATPAPTLMPSQGLQATPAPPGPTGAMPATPAPGTAPPPGTGAMPVSQAAHVSSTSLPPGQISVTQPSGGGGGKMVAIIVVVLLLLGGGGAAAYFLVLQKGGDSESSGDAVAQADGSDDMAADDMAAGDMAAGDMAAGDMAADDMAAGDMAADDMAADDMAAGDMAAGDMAVALPTPMSRDAQGGDDMAADTVAIRLVTRPRGASVTKDGDEVCRTPCSVKVAAGSSETYLLQRSGYHDKSVAVSSNGSRSLSFRLRRDRRPVAARYRRPPRRRATHPVMRRHTYRPPPMRRRASSSNPFAAGID